MVVDLRSLAAGVVVAGLGAGVLIVLPGQADTQPGVLVTSASMPGWVAWSLVALGTVLALSALFERPAAVPEGGEAQEDVDWRGSARAGITMAIAALYAVAMPWLGFMLATAGALAALALVFGARSWLGLALTALLVSPALYFFFTRLMVAPLPAGMLFR